jgi:hypothetical protein
LGEIIRVCVKAGMIQFLPYKRLGAIPVISPLSGRFQAQARKISSFQRRSPSKQLLGLELRSDG